MCPSKIGEPRRFCPIILNPVGFCPTIVNPVGFCQNKAESYEVLYQNIEN